MRRSTVLALVAAALAGCAGQGASSFIDVGQYGARPNGAADATVSIQAALDAVPSGGGTVFVPRGTYRITAPLVISTDGTVLAGEGWASVLDFQEIGEAPLGSLIGWIHVFRPGSVVKAVRITGLHLRGQHPRHHRLPPITLQTPNAIALGQGGLAPSSVTDSIIDRNFIEGFPGQAIIATSGPTQYGTGNIIKENVCFDADGAGINAVSGNIVRAQVVGNVIRHLNGIGIEWSSDGAIIARNVIHDVEGSGIVTEANPFQSLWTIIADNQLHDIGRAYDSGPAGNGIQLGESYGQRRVHVTRNVLQRIWGHGITRTGNNSNSSEFVIDDNIVEKFGRIDRPVTPDYGVGAWGISLRNTQHVVVRRNIIVAGDSPWAAGVGIDLSGGLFRGDYGDNAIRGSFKYAPMLERSTQLRR